MNHIWPPSGLFTVSKLHRRHTNQEPIVYITLLVLPLQRLKWICFQAEVDLEKHDFFFFCAGEMSGQPTEAPPSTVAIAGSCGRATVERKAFLWSSSCRGRLSHSSAAKRQMQVNSCPLAPLPPRQTHDTSECNQ